MGQVGEAGWTIGHRSISGAMGKTDKGNVPENIFSVKCVAQEWTTLDKQAKQGEHRVEGEKWAKELRTLYLVG